MGVYQVGQCKIYCWSRVSVLIRLGISSKKNGFAAVLLFIDESPKEGFSSPGQVQCVRPNSQIQLRSECALPRFIIHRLLSDGKARRVRLCDGTKQNNVTLVLRFVVLKKALSKRRVTIVLQRSTHTSGNHILRYHLVSLGTTDIYY